MNALFAKVRKALAITSITPKSHPVLVSLLQMAGQAPGLAALIPPAVHTRLSREWSAIACAVVALDLNGVTDEDLKAAFPLEGLSFDAGRGWRMTSPQSLEYRAIIHRALLRVLTLKRAKLRPFEIRVVEDLRDARRKNGLPAIENGEARAVLLSRMWPGRRILVSTELYKKRVFSILESDEFGVLTALQHENSQRDAKQWNENNPPRS